MTRSRRPLTEVEKATLTNALQIAREQFERNITYLQELEKQGQPAAVPPGGVNRLVDQFRRQQSDSLLLMVLIDDAADMVAEQEHE
jgi:hypothetical protein